MNGCLKIYCCGIDIKWNKQEKNILIVEMLENNWLGSMPYIRSRRSIKD